MRTLACIQKAGENVARFQKTHGRNAKTDEALSHLRQAYALLRANGAK